MFLRCEEKGGKTREQHFHQALYLCLSEAVHGAEQDFSRSLTVWSVCSDTYLVSGSHPISLEGLTLTDRDAEGGPCSELSWVGLLIFLFVSLTVARWRLAEMTPLALGPFPLTSHKFPIETSYTVAWFYMCQDICCRVLKLVRGRSSSRC